MSYSTDRRFMGNDPWASAGDGSAASVTPTANIFTALLAAPIAAVGSAANAVVSTVTGAPSAPTTNPYTGNKKPINILPIVVIGAAVIGFVAVYSKRAGQEP